MNDRVNQYINGNFDYEGGTLFFSCARIELEVMPGTVYSGSFELEEESGDIVSGKVYSSEMRMQCVDDTFRAPKAEIEFTFDATRLDPSDVVQGEFYIISDKGEYVLPFVVNMVRDVMDSSMGNIKNLFHFTNLAKSNWEEACKVFAHPGFIEVLNGNEEKFKNLYRGLVTCEDVNRSLEEFLIGINKKQKIEYIPDKFQLKLENQGTQDVQVIKIERNGWGYTQLEVTVEGDFLHVEKGVLTDNDFLGNCCNYEIFVDGDLLHEGNNFANVIFSHPYGNFCVEVLVHKSTTHKKAVGLRRQKSMIYSLTRHYLDYRMMKLGQNKWLSLTQDLLSHRKNLEDDGVESALFEAQLLITQERYNEAKWILDHAFADEEELDAPLYCYYLYLTTLYNMDEVYTKEVAKKVQNIFERQSSDWRIAWLLLYLSKDLKKSATMKWNFCLQQIKNGCKSPIFYVEAIHLLNSHPELLMRLGTAEKYLIHFGVKNEILTSELIHQVVYIAGKTKEFDPYILKTLMMLYEKNAQDDILESICITLMKGNCTDERYFIWYEKGIQKHLQITKLYEYYMMSLNLNEDTELSKRVLMYFSYECTLEPERTAYLYAYVEKNKHKLTDLYEIYASQIERFLLKQLYAGKIDVHLAYLYQEVVVGRMMTPDNARQLAGLLLKHEIRVEDKRICRVVVLDERLKEPLIYPVEDGMALVELPGSDYTLLLEDWEGNRYFTTREYSTYCYFLPRKLMSSVSVYAADDLILNLYLCSGNKEYLIINEQNVRRYEFLERCDVIEEEYAKMIRMKLFSYYFEADDAVAFEEFMLRLTPDSIPKKDRAELVRYLAIRGYYNEAYQYILYYGPKQIDPKTIVRVCSARLEQEDAADETMTHVVYSAFERGKYNENLLYYLIKNYGGPLKKLRNIWKAAKDFALNSHEICEKIILQMLETKAYIGEEKSIFKDYALHGARADVELAYIAWNSYQYMVEDRIVDAFVFTDLETLYEKGEDIPNVCMLAYLKHHAENVRELPQQSKKVCSDFLHELIACEKIMMPYFLEYKEISDDVAALHNMTLVEYKGNPGSTVVIHYMVNQGEDSEGGYIREEMRNMYGGIFVKMFLLFFGESLQYYITEEYDNREQLTESGTVQKNDALSELSNDRYSMINDIAVANTLKDYATVRNLLSDYEKTKYLTEQLFTIQ